MAKPTAQQCHALTTYWMQAYNEVVGRQVTVNRNKARWGWEGLLMDFTPTEARELVDYYLRHYDKPSIEWFLFNYEKVDAERQERAKKAAEAERRRHVTEERLKEWRARWNK